MVKVVANISLGFMSSTKMNFSILSTITVVLPLPGPATRNNDWSGLDRMAFFWSSFEEMSLSRTFTTISSNSSFEIIFFPHDNII